MDAVITVFTPTYNRAHTLPRLYRSLVNQTDKRFLWLLVDDGSTDNTKALIESWKQENLIRIQYEYQVNQGKSMAHNRGVSLSETELFTCVDSDDYLTENAVSELLNCWKTATDENVGILCRKRCENNSGFKLMNIPPNQKAETTLKNAYDHLGLVGDTMLVFRTSIISKYSFPKFEGENFVPEGYLYDLIDQDGTLIVLDKALYLFEYLEDGYTHNMAKLLRRNSQGYFAYINQRLSFDNGIICRALDTIRYLSMAIAVKKKGLIRNSQFPVLSFCLYPAGYLLFIKKYKNIE